MAESKPSQSPRSYPAPTIVVGVGRLGLAVLEELGESWRALHEAGGDATVANLRLLHVNAASPGGNGAAPDEDPAWRAGEQTWAAIAEFIGADDGPALAVDFVLLRTLGLVRYRHGVYEVAAPRDHGLLETPDRAHARDDEAEIGERHPEPEPTAERGQDVERPPVRRVRSFEWRELSPDPVVACDVLHLKLQREADLAQFVSPLLQRIKRGHSPTVILHLVMRYRLLAEGRDPSPWSWQPANVQSQAFPHLTWEERNALHRHLEVPQSAHPVHLLLPFRVPEEADAQGLVQTPIDPVELLLLPWERDGWVTHAAGETGPGYWVLGRESRFNGLDAEAADAQAPNEPTRSDGKRQELPGRDLFERPSDRMDLFPLLLGLYDDDQREFAVQPDAPTASGEIAAAEVPESAPGRRDDQEWAVKGDVEKNVAAQLQKLGERLMRGLYGLFIDMRLGKLVEQEVPVHEARELRDRDAAVEQSVDILAEFLVRPWRDVAGRRLGEATLTSTANAQAPSASPPPSHSGGASPGDAARAGSTAPSPQAAPRNPPVAVPESFTLGHRPSRTLQSCVVPSDDKSAVAAGPLERRLAKLGAGSVEAATVRQLFAEVRLSIDDLNPKKAGEHGGYLALRRSLARQAADLLSASRQAQYRHDDEKRPPRLTVFIVGDLGEPFVRSSVQAVLGAVHAELLRSFGPVFSSYRVGFDRTLSIIPVLWTPHPSGGAEAGVRAREGSGTRVVPQTTAEAMKSAVREEGAILDCLFNLRRRIDQMPQGERCVPLLYMNARVTECAVLSVRDSVRQTHDFLSLVIRHNLGQDPWLSNLVVGPSGRDILSTFVCLEAEFPAARIRDYLAARLGRNVVRGLLRQGGHVPEPTAAASAAPEPLPSDHARRAVQEACDARGEAVADIARAPLLVQLATPPQDIVEAWGPKVVEELRGAVASAWRDLTGSRARMDELTTGLRAQAASTLQARIRSVEDAHDSVVRRTGSALSARDVELVLEKDAALLEKSAVEAERARRAAEARCRSQGIPDSAPLAGLAEAVQHAGRRKLDARAVLLGVAFAILAGLACFGPVVDAVLAALGVGNIEGSTPQIVRVRLAPWLGALLLGGATGGLLYLLLRRSTQRVVDAIEALAGAARALVAGPEGSIASFLDARLLTALALFMRERASTLAERARRDLFAGQRITRALRALDLVLRRRAEELGARPGRSDDGAGPVVDDLDGLFRAGVEREPLARGSDVDAYYREATRGDPRAEAHRAPVTEIAGDVMEWRRQAPFSRVDAVLDYGRRIFKQLVEVPVHALPIFAEGVAARRRVFLQRHRAAFGLSTGFIGHEGGDTDGVRVLANGTVVAAPGTPDEDLRMPRREVPIRSTATYLLSVAQGIAPDTAHGLMRRQSAHERAAFPGAPSGLDGNKLHIFTGLGAQVLELHGVIKTAGTQGNKPEGGAGKASDKPVETASTAATTPTPPPDNTKKPVPT